MKKVVLEEMKTKRVIDSVGASLAFEGLKPSKYAQNIGKQYLENAISSKEAIVKVKAMHASRFGK